MSLFIDSTNFKPPLNIPESGNTEGLAELNTYIDRFELECLKKVLGFDLAKAVIDAPNDSRWDALKQGADFTYKNRNGHWVGFETDDSPLINYVWYMYIKHNAMNAALIGTVVSQTDNNRTVTPRYKMIDAWNSMVDLHLDLYRYLKANKTLYPEWKQWQQSCCCHHGYDYWYNSWFDSWPLLYEECGINEVFIKRNSFDI